MRGKAAEAQAMRYIEKVSLGKFANSYPHTLATCCFMPADSVTSGKGGLSWYIFENKNMLNIPAEFAGLFTVIVIGLIVENMIFRSIESATVRRWGMQS
jgi:ABC-type nitrate/sulfonate/bicarbonate transport system permease component